MTNQDQLEALKLIALTNLTIESITELRDTSMYRGNVKSHARALESSLIREFGNFHKEVNESDPDVYQEVLRVIDDICSQVARIDVKELIDLSDVIKSHKPKQR